MRLKILCHGRWTSSTSTLTDFFEYSKKKTVRWYDGRLEYSRITDRVLDYYYFIFTDRHDGLWQRTIGLKFTSDVKILIVSVRRSAIWARSPIMCSYLPWRLVKSTVTTIAGAGCKYGVCERLGGDKIQKTRMRVWLPSRGPGRSQECANCCPDGRWLFWVCWAVGCFDGGVVSCRIWNGKRSQENR